MAHTEKSIEVNVPVRTAYNQWTQFEEFPRFMQGVEEVRQLDNQRLYWRAEIGGKTKEWEAEIVEQTPDQRVAWRNTTGAPNGGVVSFHPIDANRTHVTLQLDYEPEGVIESVGSALGFVSGRVEGDLQRFKEYIEARGVESGAWRGEVHGGQVATGTSSGLEAGAAAGTTTGFGSDVDRSTMTTNTPDDAPGSGLGASAAGTSSGFGSDLDPSTMTTGTTQYDATTSEATTSASAGATTLGTAADTPTTGGTAAPAGSATSGTTLDQGGEAKVPIVEEELQVGTREVEGGGVRVTTRVEEVPVNEQVTLREEAVDVQRRPADRPVTDADAAAFQQGTFEVRERSEEVVTDKQARVVEEVAIRKDVQERTETVQDTVRRTDVDVSETGEGTRTSGYQEGGRGDESRSV